VYQSIPETLILVQGPAFKSHVVCILMNPVERGTGSSLILEVVDALTVAVLIGPILFHLPLEKHQSMMLGMVKGFLSQNSD